MTRGRVIVEIEELVLHGFAHADRRAIGDAVQDELGACLAGWRPAVTGDRHRVDGGSFAAPQNAAAAAIGAGIARQVRGSVR